MHDGRNSKPRSKPVTAERLRWAGLALLGPVMLGAAEVAIPDAAPLKPATGGMEQDGRIPLGVRPDNLTNPDRWRYVPENRLLGGPPWQRLFVSAFPIPLVSFDEATGAGLGVGFVDIEPADNRRTWALGGFALRTSGGLETYRGFVSWRLAHSEVPGGVIYEERSNLTVAAGYERNPVRRFFGIGADTAASDETSYTDEVGDVSALWRRGLPAPDGDVTTSLTARFSHRNLAEGIQSGVPSTDTLYPELTTAADGIDALWVGGGVRWDVRDSEASPYRGGTVALDVAASPVATDERTGGIATFSGVFVQAIPAPFHDSGAGDLVTRGREENPPTDTLAFGAQVNAAWGDLPYPDLPSLGGKETLRGYLADRFTDQASWHASAEWRLWVLPRGVRVSDNVYIQRLGLAPFVDVGSVAESLADLPDATIRHSVGLGLRMMWERDLLFRLDIARSPDQVGVNFDFGYSF